MPLILTLSPVSHCHASQEACELKLCNSSACQRVPCHASQEACELKWEWVKPSLFFLWSRLARGVWVEIAGIGYAYVNGNVTPRKRRVSWNGGNYNNNNNAGASRLARGVWVEITDAVSAPISRTVTPRKRRVSWNVSMMFTVAMIIPSRLARGVWVEIRQRSRRTCKDVVTPRKRRVSWNKLYHAPNRYVYVTPRKRRVSWNGDEETRTAMSATSRLARGVWVEMPQNIRNVSLCYYVTPRKRRVSWNVGNQNIPSRAEGHASQEACELKYIAPCLFRRPRPRHASQEACELKSEIDKTDDTANLVTPRKRRVSWNKHCKAKAKYVIYVTPRKRRVSWNAAYNKRQVKERECHASQEACELKYRWSGGFTGHQVTPRMRRVSWNLYNEGFRQGVICHASHEACELKLL